MFVPCLNLECTGVSLLPVFIVIATLIKCLQMFLRVRSHRLSNPFCLLCQVKVENRTQYLTCVCMACLERYEHDRTIRCRFCGQKWDGSSLVLGTMYSYDIFMATPCCAERVKVNNIFAFNKFLLFCNVMID